jgi:hypothetical protein
MQAVEQQNQQIAQLQQQRVLLQQQVDQFVAMRGEADPAAMLVKQNGDLLAANQQLKQTNQQSQQENQQLQQTNQQLQQQNELSRQEVGATKQAHTDLAQRHDRVKSLAPLLLIWVAGAYLSDFLSRWQTFPMPHKYVAALYYYVCVVPLKWFTPVWQYCSTLTTHPNLNHVIGGFGVLMYAAVGIGIGLSILGRLNIKNKAGVVLAPAAFSAIWLGISWLL